MKLHFPWNDVKQLLEEINTAQTARTLYGEETGKGLWLVGDHGVYLMPNTTDGVHHAKLGKDDKRLVVYANECNPDRMKFDEWWDSKRRSFGGDDGVEFISLEDVVSLAAGCKSVPKSLEIAITPNQFQLAISF